ncbi:MAG TPA: sugar phosphate nucleotidyltransferase [Gemmatimonadaceae bacterium]|nr:sugar phosphate nucleotidyltransferase [Gemmatimonadaceae bacterium]
MSHDPTPSAHLPTPDELPPPPVEITGVDSGVGTLEQEQPEAEALLGTDASLYAVVLAGGIGSRFWPLATIARPKPLLPLANERPLIADTVARLSPLVPPERVLVVTSADIADALHRAIPAVPSRNMLVEPHPMGTAAALAWAAQEIARRAGPETVFCALHADLAVGLPGEFRRAVRRAAGIAAQEEALVVVGARPTRPETGFGYLLPGEPLDGAAGTAQNGPCRVVRFVEKPGPQLAESLIAEGALWSTGTFVWRARVVLDEMTRAPEIAPALGALAAGDLPGFAGGVQHVSLDRALLERSERLVVLPGDFVWDDIGTWASLRRARELDDQGNGAVGPAYFAESSGNLVHTEGGPVVLYGVDSLVVVSLDGFTFVTTLERAGDLSGLLRELPGEFRPGA